MLYLIKIMWIFFEKSIREFILILANIFFSPFDGLVLNDFLHITFT